MCKLLTNNLEGTNLFKFLFIFCTCIIYDYGVTFLLINIVKNVETTSALYVNK